MKLTASLICLLLSLLVCPANLLAFNLTGSVHGGSAALANAQVQLYSTATNSQVGGTATTDSSGGYTISSIANGTYKLFITPPQVGQFNPAWISDPLITFNGDDVVRDVTLLLPSSTLSGTVRNPAGAGASNTQVCAYLSGTYNSKCATSDSTGAYAITGLDSGSYRLDVSGGRYYVADSNIATPYGFSITGYVAALPVTGAVPQNVTLPFVTLSGKTTDSNGTGVSGVKVSVPYTTWGANGVSYTCRNDGSSSYSVVSGADGSYGLVLLSYGNYALDISAPSGGQFVNAWISGYSMTESKVQNIILSKSVAEHKLSLSFTGTGAGSVSSSPAGISSLGLPVSWFFDVGTQVTLTATAASGSTFAGWTGACSGTAPCAVTLNSDLSVAAKFDKYPTLTVTLSGTGSGDVNSVPSIITCSSRLCPTDLAPGTQVTLVATPDANSVFDGWQGACLNKTGDCTLTLNEAASVSATFVAAPMVMLSGSGQIPFSLLQSAYQAAASGDDILSREGELAEALLFSRPVAVKIEGGYDTSFSKLIGTTKIAGFLKIRNGTVRAVNIAVH